MSRDPGSVWKPLPEAGAPDGHTKTQFIVHSTGTMATAAANWAYFNRSDVVVESTFIVGLSPADPTLQIMDSTDNADANGSANRRGISVEVVGDGVGPYTDWQIRELIRLGRWAASTHPIERRIIPSEAASGFGWHVMFGAPGPWTTQRGKVCPGARRIAELKSTVFPAIFGGTPLEDDMPYFSQWPHEEKLALAAFIVDGVLRTQFPMRGGRVGTTSLEQEIAWLPANLTAVAAAASGAADVEELRSVLLEAVQAGKSADAGATADEIVDALAARLGKPA